MHRRLTIQESLHRLARKIFHGQRGELRQAYREGQEDQLGALGLVLNAVVLWNTRYTGAAVDQLRAQGHQVADEDAARLSPLADAHINMCSAGTPSPLTTNGRYPATRLPAHEIAWSAVRRSAADPWGSAAGAREERRTGSLELLAVYSQLVKVLQRRLDLTTKGALDAGADYGQIATACGVSRQAVRQRWMRRTAGPGWYEVRPPYPRPRSWTGRPHGGEPAPAVVVRLAGGPHDGGRDSPPRVRS